MKSIKKVVLILVLRIVCGALVSAEAPTLLPLPELPSKENINLRPGQAQILMIDAGVIDVVVGDPHVVDIRVLSPQELLLNAKAEGWTTLLIKTRSQDYQQFELTVVCPQEERGLADIAALATKIGQLGVTVTLVEEALVLEGWVESAEMAKRAEQLALLYHPQVVNLLQVAPPPPKTQIQIKIKVVEMTHEQLQQLGIDWQGKLVWQGEEDSGLAAAGLGTLVPETKMAVDLACLLQEGKANILAEPTLLTSDGQVAEFLAGGQVPVPINSNGQTSIIWKEYGVRLQVKPQITGNGEIILYLRPEVSTLDWANGVRLAGATLPALRSRWVETEVRTQSGQTITLAGLLQNATNAEARGVPYLKDIPYLGRLFSFMSKREEKHELVIFVTPVVLED